MTDPRCEMFMHSVIDLSNYRGAVIRKMIPKGCSIINENSVTNYPWNKMKYTIPNRPNAGSGQLATYVQET